MRVLSNLRVLNQLLELNPRIFVLLGCVLVDPELGTIRELIFP